MAKTENDSKQQESAEKNPEKKPEKKTGGSTSRSSSDATKDKTIRILEAMNKKLRKRVKQLELKHAGIADEPEGGDTKKAEAEEDRRFSSMIKGLRGDIDAAYILKNALETDLNETRNRLAEEETAREQFEARAEILEAKAALADQLREDISFVEAEQNKTFRRLGEVSAELTQAQDERDSLAEGKLTRDARIAELLKQRFELEADIVELKERLEEMVSFFSEKSSPPSGARQPGGPQENRLM